MTVASVAIQCIENNHTLRDRRRRKIGKKVKTVKPNSLVDADLHFSINDVD
jgi:hypothetical protein